jgi:hypothetical protein
MGWAVSFTSPEAIPQDPSPQYQSDRRLGGTQSRFGHCGVEKNILPQPGIEPRSSSLLLYQLSYRASKAKLLKHYAMKASGEMDVEIHIFLSSALAGSEWSAPRLGRFTTGKRASGTHWIKGCVKPRAGLDEVEKRKFFSIQGFEHRYVGRAARSQSLYWLRYPSFKVYNY